MDWKFGFGIAKLLEMGDRSVKQEINYHMLYLLN
jgi:hypothetical protein